MHYVPSGATINSRWANKDETRAAFFNRMTKKQYDHFDSLIVESHQDNDKKKQEKYRRLHDFNMIYIFPYYKFFDHTLTEEDRENYYFEREWRVVENVDFRLEDIRNVLLPPEYEDKFKKDFPDYGGTLNKSEAKSK